MTKAEELKLLGKIEELIESADADSYIRMTFDGIGAVCMENIRADFGNCPVRDLDELREQFSAEVVRHDETKHLLAEAQGKLAEAIRDMDGMQKQVAELTEQRDAMSDCVTGLQEIVDKQDAEIRRLKAEIVRMRLSNMTEFDLANLYEKTEG